MADQPQQNQKVTIDGQDYALGDLSDEAKLQISQLRYIDGQITEFQNKATVFRMARQQCMEKLKAELPENSVPEITVSES